MMKSMFIRWIAVGLATLALAAAAQTPGDGPNLSRLAEEAEVLRQNAPKIFSVETLEQRAIMPPTRFHPRIGAASKEVRPTRQVVREVVSEYTVGTLRDSETSDLVELRQVISVDGHSIQSPESARRALSVGVRSVDEHLRKRMLEDLAKHGLVDIATDYGLILLAFSKRGLQRMKLKLVGEEEVGTDTTVLLHWEQQSSEGGELEFHGKQVAHHALQGYLWLRKSDGLPLRVSAWVEHSEAHHQIRDDATVDYVVSPHGFLTPASVLHHHLVDGNQVTQNLYRYEPFKFFAAESGITFTPDPDTARAPAKK